MKNGYVSNVEFNSNLEPISKPNNIDDSVFLSHIHDPFNLEILKKCGRYRLTELQEREFRQTSMHCIYAYPDDYPFGTVLSPNGLKVVCKCLKTDCPLFSKCRPDFNNEELDVLQENQKLSIKIQDFSNLSVDQGDHISEESDNKALSEILNKNNNEEADSKNTNAIKESEVISTQKVSDNTSKNTEENNTDVIQDINFSSFIKVDQKTIIESSPRERVVVNAGPGTGKTYTLIERIGYLISEELAEPENILVLCFSKEAVKVIQNRFEFLDSKGEAPNGWKTVDIRTFDSFATYLISWTVENLPEMLPHNYSLDAENYEDRITTAISIIENVSDLFEGYQQIIVDEVQDLVGNRAKLVLSMLRSLPEDCGFTLLGDSCQSLYDYLSQNNSQIMSSSEFYKAIFHAYKNCKYYSLTENHRQKGKLASMTLPYRDAIISGDINRCEEEAERINEQIQVTASNLKHFTSQNEKEYLKKGTLGILTRTNAQALQISAWLRNADINHIFQRPSEDHHLAEWIFMVLSDAESDVIDENEFTKIFISYYSRSKDIANVYWQALISGEVDSTNNHHKVEDVLKGIIHNGRNALLFENPGDDMARITVSNIHRAKGKEFDSVIVLGDVIDAMADQDNPNLLEDKVCYVALTRAKNSIEKAEISDQYIYVSKDDDRRCFKAGYRKKYLSHFEVGHTGDVDETSFADSMAIQNYIRDQIVVGERLKLIKCKEGFKDYTAYRIVPEDDEKVTLGYTTRSFSCAMIKALQRIFDNYHSDLNKYLPNILSDIYVDHKITCISEHNKLPGSIQFGDVQLWMGVSISGFAQRENDRY